jgi:hypothetical protein
MIENIESNFMIFESICNFKEKPLRVTISIDIILKQ